MAILNNNFGKKDSYFARNEGSRIVYYRIDSHVGTYLWDNHWEDNVIIDLKKFYRPFLRGYLGYGQLRHILLKHLPREGLILEGGCGMSQFVVALRSRGYNCFGVDFAPRTVERVKSYLHDLPIQTGDICRLELNNESIAAYISLGVMEHFQDKPDRALKEASRVLKKNGILIVSVPQAFRWRRLNAYDESTPLPDNASFYQYAFPPEEFREILIDSGFQIEAEYGYGSHYAFRVCFKFFKKLLRWLPQLRYIDLFIDKTPFGRNISRMRVFIARKI